MRGRRGIRAATVTLGVATAVAICLAVLGVATGAPRAWASESPTASFVKRVLQDVRVHSGQRVWAVFRVDGEVVRVPVQDRQTTLGVPAEWRGQLRLRAGSDVLVAHTRDAAGRPVDYRVYFKGGWLSAFVLANQAARLERRVRR